MEEISDRIFVKLNDVTYIKFRRYKEKNILVKYSAIRASIHDKNNQGHWFECFEAFSFNIFTPLIIILALSILWFIQMHVK